MASTMPYLSNAAAVTPRGRMPLSGTPTFDSIDHLRLFARGNATRSICSIAIPVVDFRVLFFKHADGSSCRPMLQNSNNGPFGSPRRTVERRTAAPLLEA